MITLPGILYCVLGPLLVVGCGIITKGKVMPGIIFFVPVGWFLHMLSEDIKLQRMKEMMSGTFDPALIEGLPTRAEFWYQAGADSLVKVIVYAALLGFGTRVFYYFKK